MIENRRRRQQLVEELDQEVRRLKERSDQLQAVLDGRGSCQRRRRQVIRVVVNSVVFVVAVATSVVMNAGGDHPLAVLLLNGILFGFGIGVTVDALWTRFAIESVAQDGQLG